METSADLPSVIQKVLLVCGVLAALLYGGGDIIGGLLKPGYRFDSQSASVLSAVGTPTRPVVLPMNIAADILLIAFAAGVWFSAGQNWALRVTAVLIFGNAIFSMVAIAFFPLHLDKPTNQDENLINAVIMGASVFCFVFAFIFGAIGNQNWLRYVSIGIILLYIVGYFIGMISGKAMPGGQNASLMGAQERTMIYTWLLWMVLQAIVLLRDVGPAG